MGQTRRRVNRSKQVRKEREQRWRGIVRQWKRSGATQVAYCRRRRISPAQLQWWKHEIVARDERRRRESVERNPSASGPAFVSLGVLPTTGIRVGYEAVMTGGRILRFSSGMNLEEVRQVMALLEGRPC